MKLRSVILMIVAGLWVLACNAAPRPETLNVNRESCASCSMVISQSDFASQLVAPGERPKFFDDLGCLKRYLEGAPEPPSGAAIFVTDHQTREWVPVQQAVFSRVPRLQTPMSSHYVAHASTASQSSDAGASGGFDVPSSEIIPAAWQTATATQ